MAKHAVAKGLALKGLMALERTPITEFDKVLCNKKMYITIWLVGRIV